MFTVSAFFPLRREGRTRSHRGHARQKRHPSVIPQPLFSYVDALLPSDGKSGIVLQRQYAAIGIDARRPGIRQSSYLQCKHFAKLWKDGQKRLASRAARGRGPYCRYVKYSTRYHARFRPARSRPAPKPARKNAPRHRFPSCPRAAKAQHVQ